MNNRTQQRFDRSIADAVKQVRGVSLVRPRHAKPALAVARAVRPRQPNSYRGWKLSLDPKTGATVYGPLK